MEDISEDVLYQEEMENASLISRSTSSEVLVNEEVTEKDITDKFSVLCQQLTNISEVLNGLVENGIFSIHEMENIKNFPTSLERNTAFFSLLLKKDWTNIQSVVIQIFRDTCNDYIADIILGSPRLPQEYNRGSKRGKVIIFALSCALLILALVGGLLYWKLRPQKGILHEKWWPRKMNLVNSFYQRKLNGSEKLLVEELHSTLQTAGKENEFTWRKVVIVGLPGIGKTETAIWFANYYRDDYDYIIWISCEKESLHTSLMNLARQLDIPGREEISQGSLAQRMFDIFSKNRCLWIFDYAEYDDSPEGGMVGIKNILLEMQYPNFDCIITSLSNDWGREADYGKIQNFTLAGFTEIESMDFLKINLHARKAEPMYEENLKRLVEVLNNYPLALQIAINSLNDVLDESLEDFIDHANIILNSTAHLPDYGKTIFTTMKISIDSIKKMEHGKLAYKIMSVFGYLRPENINMTFFGSVLPRYNTFDLKEALNLLQNRFLIRVTEKDVMDFPGKQSLGTLNVNRLLQLFMRTFVNETKSEKEILINILGANGFIPYKLTPYAEYAVNYDDLKERFNHLKAQLIEQLQLDHFIHSQQFEEAVLLSKIIHTGYTNTSDNGFLASAKNYGLCLHKAGKLNEALEIFFMLDKSVAWIPTNNLFGINLDLTLIIDKFQSSVWGIGLLRRLGMINESLELQKELAYESKVWSYIIKIHDFIEPIDLYTFKDNNILTIQNTQVYIDENFNTNSSSEDAVVKDFLEFYGVAFVDRHDQFLKTINFTQLQYTSTNGLYVYCSRIDNGAIVPSNIHLDVSELRNTTEMLTLSTMNFFCTEENPNIQVLFLDNITNFHHASKYLPKLTNLQKLHIGYSCWSYPTDLSNYYFINEIEFEQVSFILSNESSTSTDYAFNNFSITCVAILNCAFFDQKNVRLSKINLTDLSITNVRELVISIDSYDPFQLSDFIPTDITVDLSRLPHLEVLRLDSAEISCTLNEPVFNLLYLSMTNVTNSAVLNKCLPRFINLIAMELENFNSSLDFSKTPKSLNVLALTNVSCTNYSTNNLSTYNLRGYGLENYFQRTKFLNAANAMPSNCLTAEFDSSLCHPELWIKNKMEIIHFIKSQTNIAFGAQGCAKSELKEVLNLIDYQIVISSDFYGIKNGIGKSINKTEFSEFCSSIHKYFPYSDHTKFRRNFPSHRTPTTI